MVMAELHIASEDFPEARRALGDLFESEPTARSLTIMAAIERGEGASDAVVKGWLAKALTAPRGAQWVCDSCHNIHSEWTPVCEDCQSFDTLTWTPPPEVEVSSPTGVEMLPLIVGSLEDHAENKEAEEVIEAELAEEAEAENDEEAVQPGYVRN